MAPNKCWLQTYSGGCFDPIEPDPATIVLEDIAHALSNQCRFSGHCSTFYSVAQHSLLCSCAVDASVAAWGLLHDASEAYLVDLPRPLKRYTQLGVHYENIEGAVMGAICRRFGLHVVMPEAVRDADRRLLATEQRDLMAPPPRPWEPMPAPFSAKILPVGPEAAKALFLSRAAALGLR